MIIRPQPRGLGRPQLPLVMLLVLLLLAITGSHAFVPRSPQQQHPQRQWRRIPLHMSSSSSSPSSSSGGSNGYRGQVRNDEEVVDLSGDGGVTKRVLRPGFGYKQETPPEHAYCKVAFIMKTSTGQIIADRMDKPMEFMLGLEKPEVIPGWELAVRSMRPNELAEVVCRSEYAFGAAEGYEDKIPPGATIVTRLQLLDWRSLRGAGSTDVQDTHELTKKWREEIDQGISPMTDWAAPPKAPKRPQSPAPPQPQQHVEDVLDVGGGGGGPLAEAQAAMDRSQAGDAAVAVDGFTAPSSGLPPFVEEVVPSSEGGGNDGPKPRVDIEDPETRRKLNPNQVVMGTAPQYRWKERQDSLELVVPVPDTVRKEDVLVHMTNRALMVGFKTPEGKENWIVGGELFGSIEREESFWVLSKGSEFEDELTEGKTCIEVRLEKKDPFRRIWANVYKDQ